MLMGQNALAQDMAVSLFPEGNFLPLGDKHELTPAGIRRGHTTREKN